MVIVRARHRRPPVIHQKIQTVRSGEGRYTDIDLLCCTRSVLPEIYASKIRRRLQPFHVPVALKPHPVAAFTFGQHGLLLPDTVEGLLKILITARIDCYLFPEPFADICHLFAQSVHFRFN
ncbi:hypothetical protein D3C73_1146830 [compost metagenome]